MFKKVLIANRGEIAVRVARACKELGIAVVAIYSEPDSKAAHVRAADEAYLVGPAASSESYLNIEKILEVIKTSGADAVHPGYGFLSERASFARACEAIGVAFIGPPADAIEKMGSKLLARQLMTEAGVPVVPGTKEPIDSLDDAKKVALEVGYPIMLKASAGGGGKGMRLVENEDELESAVRAARGEAGRSFGDDAVYLEKFVVEPRHVEVQIFADSHGHTVHVGERDCSVQRRHQKVIEESPCPILRPEVREKMGVIAIRAAEAVGYVGAGTVEFLLDANQDFYFMEMNTRLQVEHPVTELVYGVDLVHAQLIVAAGGQLPFTQSQLQRRGTAIECRIYAEDPEQNFRPSPGPVHWLREPAGPWVRVDSGIYQGFDVPIHYDPMISKLAVWGATRIEAIGRMKRALGEYLIGPVRTNIPFHLKVMDNPKFISGAYTTAFIAEESANLGMEETNKSVDADVLVAAAIAKEGQIASEAVVSDESTGGGPLWPWADRVQGWR